jgi:hypothetical protein
MYDRGLDPNRVYIEPSTDTARKTGDTALRTLLSSVSQKESAESSTVAKKELALAA